MSDYARGATRKEVWNTDPLRPMVRGMPDIFLSYSRDDQLVARRFAEGFEREGFSVWWDQTLHSGENYDQVTEAALREAKAVVVLWSTKSVDSRWVRAEATNADRAGTLVPAMIEACRRPIMFELKQTADLAHWKGESGDPAWRAFLSDVRRFIGKGQSVEAMPAPQAHDIAKRAPRIAKPLWLAAVLVLGACGLWSLLGMDEKPASGVPVATAPEAARTPVTLAVLPFVNLSSDPEQEYFSDGLTEEILNQLAQVKAMRVTGRTSSFAFKGKNEDLRSIAGQLGVANLLEGSVRRDGGSLRITAQLINGKDGAHLWSQTYDRELSKVFAVQEDIAKDVAQALSITLDVGDMSRSQGGTTNVEAYDRFLRGRQLARKDSADTSAEAVRLFREAVTLDPAFSRAWVDLNAALFNRGIFVPREAASLQREVNDSLARVRMLAPQAWWTHLLNSRVLLEQHKWSEADAEIRAALAASPGGEPPLELALGYLDVMWSIGRVREGLELGERAMARNPLDLSLARYVQAMLDCAGRPGDAQAEYERTKARVGSSGATEYWTLARLLLREDASLEAIRAQLLAVGEKGSKPVGLSAQLSERLPDRGRALAAVRKAFEDPSTQGIVAFWAIGMYADRFGDKDLALAAMRKWVVDVKGFVNIIWWPYTRGLRSDPRFKQIVRETGLVEFWRSSNQWGDYCRPLANDDFECS
jgi:TolB-like protein